MHSFKLVKTGYTLACYWYVFIIDIKIMLHMVCFVCATYIFDMYKKLTALFREQVFQKIIGIILNFYTSFNIKCIISPSCIYTSIHTYIHNCSINILFLYYFPLQLRNMLKACDLPCCLPPAIPNSTCQLSQFGRNFPFFQLALPINFCFPEFLSFQLTSRNICLHAFSYFSLLCHQFCSFFTRKKPANHIFFSQS